MPSKLKPPMWDSGDYTSTAIGIISATKPVSITFPQPIGTLRFNPAVGEDGRDIPIYTTLLPICPEKYVPQTSHEALIQETIRLFWEDQLMPKLEGIPRRRQIEICEESLSWIVRKNRGRKGSSLPDGLECQISFEGLITTNDIVPNIQEDEAYVRKLYDSHAPIPARQLPVPQRASEAYSSSVIGMIVALHSGCINLPPFGTFSWNLGKPEVSDKVHAIFIDVIPILPVEHCGIISVVQRERMLFIDRFWDTVLSDMIGREKHAKRIITSLKQRVRRLTNHEMLPQGLVARIGFGNLRPIDEQFPHIVPDMDAVRKAMSHD